MSWTRFGQLSGETQSLANVAGLGGSGYSVSNTTAFSGSWSYRTSGTNAPLGFAGALGVAARCGMQFRHAGQSVNNAVVIGMLIDGCSLVFRFNEANNDVTLLAGYTSNTTNVRTPTSANVPALADQNTWRHVGMVAYLAASGGFVSLYIDGVAVLSWTGDTRLYRSGETTPRTAITGIYVAGTGTAWTGVGAATWANYAYIDDLYFDSWTGESAPTDAPAPTRRFGLAVVEADGDSTQWTPTSGSDNYAMLTDRPPDDDTSTVTAGATGLVDLYHAGGFTLPVDHVVRAVIPMALMKKTDAGVDSRAKLQLKLGDTVASDAKVLPTSYGYVWERWTRRPDDTAWDEAAVNSIQIGLESAGDFDG